MQSLSQLPHDLTESTEDSHPWGLDVQSSHPAMHVKTHFLLSQAAPEMFFPSVQSVEQLPQCSAVTTVLVSQPGEVISQSAQPESQVPPHSPESHVAVTT